MSKTPPGQNPSNDPDEVDLSDVGQQRGLILSILCDFLEDDRVDQLCDWLDHVGFDLTALRDPSDLLDAWLGHYRCGRGYDVDRATNDLVTWPPIAKRIAALSKQKAKLSLTGRNQRHVRKPAG